jgi:hypothetical protein
MQSAPCNALTLERLALGRRRVLPRALRRQHGAAQPRHRRFEGQPRAGGGLVEERRHDAALEHLGLGGAGPHLLHQRGLLEDGLDRLAPKLLRLDHVLARQRVPVLVLGGERVDGEGLARRAAGAAGGGDAGAGGGGGRAQRSCCGCAALAGRGAAAPHATTHLLLHIEVMCLCLLIREGLDLLRCERAAGFRLWCWWWRQASELRLAALRAI